MVGMDITSFPPKGFDKIDYLAFMRVELFFFFWQNKDSEVGLIVMWMTATARLSSVGLGGYLY